MELQIFVKVLGNYENRPRKRRFANVLDSGRTLTFGHQNVVFPVFPAAAATVDW